MGLSGHIRTAPEAALELYKKSVGHQTEYPIRGTDIYDADDTTLYLREGQYELETGIKTFVVAMVDADSPKVSALRDQLNAVAASGQPKFVNGEWVPDPDQKAIFISKKNGVAEGMRDFIQEIREKIINRIYQDYIEDTKEDNNYLYPTSIASLFCLNDDATSGKMYQATFQKNKLDQWRGDFNCFNLAINSDDIEQDTQSFWTAEAGLQMRDKGLSRNLYTSAGSQNSTNTDLLDLKNADFNTLATTMGLADVDSDTLLNFKNWFLNPASDGHSDPTAPTDITPLGDMQHSNFLCLERDGNPDNIYFQTNRGTLHELNAETGEENWAFVPPNVFQGRLKSLKFDEDNNYYDSNPTNGRRSLALNLLDGKITSSLINGKRILLGTLGRGGNGLYAMDITAQNDPQFLWAVENPRYSEFT